MYVFVWMSIRIYIFFVYILPPFVFPLYMYFPLMCMFFLCVCLLHKYVLLVCMSLPYTYLLRIVSLLYGVSSVWYPFCVMSPPCGIPFVWYPLHIMSPPCGVFSMWCSFPKVSSVFIFLCLVVPLNVYYLYLCIYPSMCTLLLMHNLFICMSLYVHVFLPLCKCFSLWLLLKFVLLKSGRLVGYIN